MYMAEHLQGALATNPNGSLAQRPLKNTKNQ